jgi:cytochrome c biogenesis protein ResB
VDGVRYLYGDRHRWTKLATLISHLGLILFLVAAAVTSRFGFESGILLTTGESQPVQAIGSPGLLVVKSYGFSDPTAADGTVLDYTTDLAVYRDGNLLARKVIRVNDPLTWPASRSTRTASGRRPTSSSGTPTASRCGTGRWRSTTAWPARRTA